MSKRINPISFRLGLSQLWKLNTSLYGQNFGSYTKLLNKRANITRALKLILLTLHVTSGTIRYKVHKNYWKILVQTCCFDSHENINSFKLNLITPCLIYYLTKQRLHLNLYKQNNRMNSALLICWWIKFYFDKNNLPLKSVIALLESELVQNVNTKKIQLNKFGLKLLRLKGIKISCKGRLGNIRNPLTQVFNKIWGSVPLTKLNSHVEYSQDYILTKRGIYGLQVWIFYS